MSEQNISSVTKALRLLLRLGELGIDGDVRLADLVAASGMSKASVFRLLADMKAAGFVEQDAVTSRYHLGRAVLILASQCAAGADLTVRAAPVMRALSGETGMTVHLSVRDGHRVVWIDKIDGKHGLQLASRIGRSAPIHSTASGKAILAASDPRLVDEVVAGG